MLRPIVNPKLSLRARSLFYYFVEKGRVISADELRSTKEFPEGRDALQSAINELKDLKYVKSVRVQNNGQWIARLKFTEEAKKLLSTAVKIHAVANPAINTMPIDLFYSLKTTLSMSKA